uniref:Polypeptide N-acetylgalactosaminyltransferase n=1 Tax=Cacopsylla melanoneura TaxID=428564 RepID=A0A8D8UD27_9HEMI
MVTLSSKMRRIQFKRGRLVRIAACVFIVVPLLYLLFSKSNELHREASLNSQSVNEPDRYLIRARPVYKAGSGLGNLEPPLEPYKEGPGMGGKAYHLPESLKAQGEASMGEYGMNMETSNQISLDRTIPDLRMEECKYWDYPVDLPKASVILVFHNEGFTSLLRTVHSVINRTPARYLEEVLLVDDFSNKEDLNEKLEDYITRFNGKVRLIRNKEREGLIRTRSRGAKESRGEVIVFLDAHCEVGLNWLPPLLAPIYSDRKIMTVPVIDGIDFQTWEFRSVYEPDHHYRGIFEWGMLYKENELPEKEAKKRKYNSEPYKSPTHAGGLFAMDRAYFLELGGYDPGLLVWGGENFELSFKIWLCGGSIEWVPCSRIGHVYRSFMPYNFGKLADKVKGPLITYNYKRVIETWFDEKHKAYFYTREPLAMFLDMGDISDQVALKNKLKCNDFSWFMKHVAYDVYTKFPELPPNIFWGEAKNQGTNKCLDSMGRSAPAVIGTSYCHGAGSSQLFRLNAQGQIGHGERCVDADKQGVKLIFCRLGTVDGPWRYQNSTRQLEHAVLKRCLSVHPETNQLAMLRCDDNNLYQQWKFKEVRPDWSS